MYAVISVHTPKPEYRDELIDSMHRFGAALQDQPGLVGAHTLAETEGNRLIGLAIFETRDAAEAAMPIANQAVANDDFGLWEASETEGFRVIEV